jgi:hypothetical protein
MDVEHASPAMPSAVARFALRASVPVLLALAPCTTPGVLHAQASRGAPAAGCASVAGPDTGATRPADASVPRADPTGTTLRILASVTADEVRFARSPVICVRLTGDAQLDSVRVVGRRNIASPVVANTTYRNVYVAVEILGRLNAECISARITGAAAADTGGSGGAAAQRCAALGVRPDAGTPRSPP